MWISLGIFYVIIYLALYHLILEELGEGEEFISLLITTIGSFMLTAILFSLTKIGMPIIMGYFAVLPMAVIYIITKIKSNIQHKKELEDKVNREYYKHNDYIDYDFYNKEN